MLLVLDLKLPLFNDLKWQQFKLFKIFKIVLKKNFFLVATLRSKIVQIM